MPVKTHVLLLRGINVGGKHRLPMKELVAILEAEGCSDVRTYIQSGNAVVQASPATVRDLASRAADAIEDQFGFSVPVVTRTATEIRRIAGNNPFLGDGADPKTLSVGFLADRPSKPRVASLDPDRSPPDRFHAHGRELYLHCPNGMARTKLTNAYLDRYLGTVSTMRNWNTVCTLAEWSGE